MAPRLNTKQTEDELIGYWHQKDTARRAKYPDGNYPPLERWDLQLAITRHLHKVRQQGKRNNITKT